MGFSFGPWKCKMINLLLGLRSWSPASLALKDMNIGEHLLLLKISELNIGLDLLDSNIIQVF